MESALSKKYTGVILDNCLIWGLKQLILVVKVQNKLFGSAKLHSIML